MLEACQLPSLYVKGGRVHDRMPECAGNFHRSLVANAIGTKVLSRPLTKTSFSYFTSKTYVVGTQKNRLDETVLLST